MLLSSIINIMPVQYQYQICNEKEFDILGLIKSDANLDMCTFLDDDQYLKFLTSNIKMLITTTELSKNINSDIGICTTDNPRILFFSIHNFLATQKKYKRKTFKTKIGKNCNINEFSLISKHNVVIGDNVTIEEFVSIKENTIIGNNSIIRAGSIISGDGFEYKRDTDGIMPVAHLGGVIIGDFVEIHHNSCIDKAVYPWDNTIIGSHVKIDNLVYIAHGVKIEDNVMIIGQSGILGRTIIQANSKIGLGASIKNALFIGESSQISIGSVVTQDVMPGSKVTGNFAIQHEKFLEHIRTIR